MNLNNKQQEVYNYVKQYIENRGFPPSIREVCHAVGFSSPRAGQKQLEALAAKGYIQRENKPRGIKLLAGITKGVTLPFFGYIAAGAPIEVVEQREDVEVPSSLVGRKPCYVLRVKGNSMIEDHILNGDFIVVEQAATADDGEVVVALTNNRSAATLKRFYKEKDRIRLEPANSVMKPIYVKDVAIQGKVRGLFRKF